jgi:geranylgeranyl diphosphate synthase, type II
MDLHNYLNSYKTTVETAMASSLYADSATPKKVVEAMTYSLEAGGKRIRPILVLAGAEAVGGSINDVMPLACAMEMIHTFSLVHDDLPAMDNDDLRRGKPTNHNVFGEAIAILAGDALLAEAFRLIAKLGETIDPKVAIEILSDVALATGHAGMVGGQVIDLESEGKTISVDELQQLHQLKTGKLIRVSVVSGAKCAGATTQQIESLTTYGEAIGLAFQIADDILDIEGSTEQLGKPQGSDTDSNKSTYPALIGMEESKRLATQVIDDAITALEGFDEKADPLRKIAKFIISRKK